MKKLSDHIRIIFVGLLFISVTYCAVLTIDITSWNYSIPVEIAMIALSLVTGLALTPIVTMFLQRNECQRYLLYLIISMAIWLMITYQIRLRWHYDPQFLTLSFVIPGVISHIAGLHILLHINPETADEKHSTHTTHTM
jgi:FlaA1/EpsC-like NDP-sugar epimerase